MCISCFPACVSNQDELTEMLGSGEFDFRFDIGITQPSTSGHLCDIPYIIELIASHYTVISVKAQLDSIIDGLRDAQLLSLLQNNPVKMVELFKSQNMCITTDAMITMFTSTLSPSGHNDREAEEALVVFWTEFIQKVEGKYKLLYTGVCF